MLMVLAKSCAFSRNCVMDRTTVFLLFLTAVIANCSDVSQSEPPRIDAPDSYIYQASIQNSSNRHICNGVIVNKNWILTLAQCVTNYNASDLKVFYGSKRLIIDGEYVDVKQIYIHPAFNQSIIKSDIALILTTHDINFTANVSGPINLPKYDVQMNELLTSSGWEIRVSKYEFMQF